MIKDILKEKGKSISFEVFPPKKEADFDSAFETLNALGSLQPDFISRQFI